MENKYYTPLIEELHVGYICEWLQMKNKSELELDGVVKDTWQKYDYKFQGLSYRGFKELIKEKSIRTKYLDKEDIESFGWEFKELIKGTFGIQKYSMANTKIQGCDFDTWYNLHADFGYKEPSISIYTEFRGGMIYTESTSCIFKGTIKSINELKLIMKWLNIN